MFSKNLSLVCRFFFLMFCFLCLKNSLFSLESKPINTYIFVKSNIGDRCHHALNSFLNKNSLEDEKIFFCKSSKDAIQKANEHDGIIFLKIVSVPNFYIHNEVALSLQNYKISKVIALVRQKVKYSLLRHEKALKNKIKLKSVASTPYTLKLYEKWIKDKNLTAIEVPGGSAEAARLLSDGILNLSTVTIASSHAGTVYKNLKVIKSDFNPKTSYNIFAMIKVKKRKKTKSISEIKQEISDLFYKHTAFENEENWESGSIVFSEDFDLNSL